MSICLSPGGSTIYDSAKFSNDLYVGTQAGVVRLEESGGQWREAGRSIPEHHVCALLREPVSGNFYAGTHDAGVFVSADGKHWQSASTGLEITNVFSLASARRPGGKVRLYAGTEPAALFHSDDFGTTWQRFTSFDDAPNREGWVFPAPPFQGHVKVIAADPFDADHLYAVVEQGGLYASTDAGATWTDHTAGMPNDAHRVLLHPTRRGRLYLANGFFFNRSDDGGRTWFEMKGQTSKIGYADQLLLNPRQPELLFVTGAFATPNTWVSGTAKSSISRSRDGGDTWEYVRSGFPDEIKPSFEGGCLEAAGERCRVFLGNTDGEVWMTADEGETWQRIAHGLPPVSKCFHADLIHGKLDLSQVRIPESIRGLMEQMVAREG